MVSDSPLAAQKKQWPQKDVVVSPDYVLRRGL